MNDISNEDFIITVIQKQTWKTLHALIQKKKAALAVSHGEITTREYYDALGKYDVEKQELCRLVKLL